MTETTLLYALSTLAQTCAALAAFVGAVGLFRLQLVREALSSAQRNLRATAADAGIVARGLEFFQPLRDIVKAVEERCATRREDDPWHVLKAGEDLARWRRALKRFQLSYVPSPGRPAATRCGSPSPVAGLGAGNRTH